MVDFLINRMLFMPSSHTDWLPPPAEIAVEDVWVTGPAGISLHAWWSQPRDWQPDNGVVLFCHGNAGNLSYRGPAIRPWHQYLQHAVLLFDYPGYGKSGGRPSEKGCYAAAEAFLTWLREQRQVPENRTLLLGRSLGGAVAIEIGHRRPFAGVVLVNTFSSLQAMASQLYPWLPTRWLLRGRFDNLAKIPLCRQPIFIGHATADQLVPFAHGEQLFAAANEPKQLFPLQDLGHQHPANTAFYTALRDFLKR